MLYISTLYILHFSYAIVCECWAKNPDNRPHFHELVTTFSGSLESIAGYLDFSLAGNQPQKSGYKPIQLQLKNRYDRSSQPNCMIISDAAVDVSVADCNIPVDVTDCNMPVDVTDNVTDCSTPVDYVTDHDTKVVIPESNEQL